MRGEEKWRPDGTGALEGWLGEGRGSHAWRDPQGLGGSGGVQLAFPLPRPGPRLSGAPSDCVGPRGVVGERRGEADGEGPSRIRGSGEMQLVSPAHSCPGRPAGVPGQVLCLPGLPPAVLVLGL